MLTYAADTYADMLTYAGDMQGTDALGQQQGRAAAAARFYVEVAPSATIVCGLKLQLYAALS